MANQKDDETGNPQNLDFYDIDASTTVGDTARKLLHEYSKIPSEQIDEHVETIRKQAFEIFPYPCIGMFRFLDLSIPTTPIYSEVLERLKNGDKLLDLGCCFGQEIRKLIFDGAPAENLVGSDLEADFISLGYDLFKDKNSLTTRFIPADVFDDSSPLWSLNGTFSMIYCGAFFHLFNYDQQVAIALRVVKLLAPKSGSLLMGRQVGNINPSDYDKSGYGKEKSRYRHNPESWKKLWEEVGEKTDTKWDVDVTVDPMQWGMVGPEVKLTERRAETGATRIHFIVRRL
ncbi:hypothetical protein BT63DRAFT_426710 [Microthyrium microscopicum]|uniref:Methyltransferase domain-containing protein n=1 Tax=Microthyrium microscopicum TaxID=703497 RepID=A0A6A6U8T2_9PEZI|nr:hypothetical protein BT63DRAFT_426710 [Microthyrium microscopicum]